MNSVAASGRSPRKAQRNSITPSIKATRSSTTNRANTPDMAGTHDEEPKTVQDLKDELEEKSETVERLKEKITQLEERAKYLEADARLKASMMSTEVLSLKEKARKLEIELSTIVDERDILEQEIDELRSQIVDGEDNDEARQLSVQLKDAWLRIKNMKATQEETVQNLFSSEEANAKLRAELATAVNASSTAKSSQVDERQKWNSEKQEFVAEINSFKEKLSLVSKNGGKQVLDWEEDKARLRNSFAHERSAWDKEKRGFLDQIASFKVKASTLTMQKATPPEWVLEKHKLTEQCATLQSRVTILETNRANEGNSSSSSVKKLEADKQKLQKKVEALRTKLVEVMLQMEEEEKKPKAGRSRRRGAAAPRRKRPVASESDSDEDEAVEIQEAEPPKAAPPAPRTRAKRSAATKQVSYELKSDDEIDDEDLEMDEADDDDQDKEEPEAVESNEEGANNDKAVPLTDDMDVDGEAEESAHPPSTSTNTRSKKAPSRKSRKAADDTSDSEFEPDEVIGRSRGRKAASPAAEPVSKKTKAASLSKSKSNETETAPVTNDSGAKSYSIASKSTEFSGAAITSKANSSSTSEAASATPSASETAVSTPTMTAEGESPTTVVKIKKKRKLLTGKGLDELGDILNGPGSSLTSASPSGLTFSKSKARIKATSSLLTATAPDNTKLETLNAIKMAFALPKARNSSPSRDS
ncbi:hypothetical protein BGZ54_006820 [Gamsiella multidivaricata]|nr:hypothetical protein BGZ54_006820 [Gamsiella multidivaricata]